MGSRGRSPRKLWGFIHFSTVWWAYFFLYMYTSRSGTGWTLSFPFFLLLLPSFFFFFFLYAKKWGGTCPPGPPASAGPARASDLPLPHVRVTLKYISMYFLIVCRLVFLFSLLRAVCQKTRLQNRTRRSKSIFFVFSYFVPSSLCDFFFAKRHEVRKIKRLAGTQ